MRPYADKRGNMAPPPGPQIALTSNQKGQRVHGKFVKRLTVKEKACKAVYASTQNSNRGEAYWQQQWQPAYACAGSSNPSLRIGISSGIILCVAFTVSLGCTACYHLAFNNPGVFKLPQNAVHYSFKPLWANTLSETRKLGRMIRLFVIFNVADLPSFGLLQSRRYNSLSLGMTLILLAIKTLKMPRGFLGGLPGPSLW